MMVELHFQTQEFLRVLKFAIIVLACFEYILGQIMLEIIIFAREIGNF